MTRYVVCSALLAAFAFGLNRALHWASVELSFGWYAVLCLSACGVIAALAFGWDHYERRHSQE